MIRKFTLEQLSKITKTKMLGDPTVMVSRLNSLDDAGCGDLTYYTYGSKALDRLSASQADVVIVSESYQDKVKHNALITDEPEKVFAELTALFVEDMDGFSIDETAKIDPEAKLAKDVAVGPYCVVSRGVRIGSGTRLMAGVILQSGVSIGSNCTIHSYVVCYPKVSLGDRVVVHSGTVIGSDGFGYTQDKEGKQLKIHQLGSVEVQDDVEIGANCTIDRGALKNTVINHGVKIDNQVQIAHNVEIGEHSVIAACTGISGSAKIGHHCVLAGGVGLNGHIELAPYVVVTGMSRIAQSIDKPGVYMSGTQSYPLGEWKRLSIRFGQLDNLVKRVKKLESDYE